MKNKWPKVIGTTVPIYGGTVVLCNSQDEYLQCERYLSTEDRKPYPRGGCCSKLVSKETGERMYLVGVFDDSVETLAHELAHAAFFILGDVGVPVREGETNEAFCYLLGYLLAEQIPHLSHRKVKK